MALNFEIHPEKFSTYVQKSAFNHYRNIALIPEHIHLPEKLDNDDRERVVRGFHALHCFFLNLYEDIYRVPENYNLPLDVIETEKSRDKVRALFKAVDGIILMILGLGITGRLDENTCELEVDKIKWLQWCKQNGCKRAEKNLMLLNRIGLEIIFDNSCIKVNYPDKRELTWALTLFAPYAHAKKWPYINRVDFRVMSEAKIKHIPEEPIKTLFGDQKKLLEELNSYLLSSGTVFDGGTPWLAHEGSWGCCYKYGKSKKTVFGFNIGDGLLWNVRIVCQNVEAVLDTIRSLPQRDITRFLESSRCGGCSCCEKGMTLKKVRPIEYEFEGVKHVLCGNAWYFNNPSLSDLPMLKEICKVNTMGVV